MDKFEQYSTDEESIDSIDDQTSTDEESIDFSKLYENRMESYIYEDERKYHLFPPETYIAEIVEDGDNVTITGMEGVPTLLSLLNSYKMVNIDRMSIIEGTSNVVFHYKKLQEFIPEEEDYQRIAHIYSTLIHMGIMMDNCKFVKREYGVDHGKILIQCPKLLLKFKGTNGPKIVKKDYMNGNMIKKCIPTGMNHVRIIEMIMRECV